MRPDIGDFEVIRRFGGEPEILCKKANFAPRGYGFYTPCAECDLRFVCATGSLYDVVGDIENEWVEVTTFGDSKKSWIRR
jgi:hypothetical protein